MRMKRLGLHLWQWMIEFLLFYCVFVVFLRHLISLFAMLKPLTYITLFTLVLLRPLGGVLFIAVCCNFYYFVLPFVPL